MVSPKPFASSFPYKNIHNYQQGITYEEVIDDPQLGRKRRELVYSKATELAEARMIVFDKERDAFAITDLGRIAAKYYIRSKTILIFNETFRAKMSEADVLHMLCKSTEVSYTLTWLCIPSP